MNIPCKYLINNNLSNEKIQYYQKLISKYSIAITKFNKNKNNLINFKKKLLDWFFSLDLENKMLVCCVENKKFTNILNKLYLYHKEDNNTKFIIKEELITLKDDENVSFFYSKKPYKESAENNFIESFFEEIIFYQSESSINNYDIYNSYFTLSKKILENENLFIDYFNKISNENSFKFPIKINYNTSNKIPIFQFPNWISNNNENNSDKYFTLNEYFCALFEQVISVRFVLYYHLKELNEIYSSCYLKEILDRKKIMINYLNSINERNKFSYFNINKLIEEMYNNQNLDNFIKKNANNEIVSNPIYFNRNYALEEIQYEINQYFKVSNKDLIEMISFIHITQLFTYDDFFCREIFQIIYDDYSKKIAEDLMENNISDKELIEDFEKKKRKKKKKKKKKEKEDNENKNLKIKNLVFEIIDNAFNLGIENEKNKNLITNINNDNQNNKKKYKKENKFFLYETIKKNKKTKEEKIKNDFQKEEEMNKKKTKINNIIDKKISNNNYLVSLFNILNTDIKNYISEQEKFLNLLHNVKRLIYNYLYKITNKVYPNSKLEMYGSSLYNLDIESSDLDLSISSEDKNLSLSSLIIELTKNNNIIYESINPILTASVPVIKLVINPIKLNDKEINLIYDSIHNNKYYKEYIFDKNEIDKIKVDIALNSINHNQIVFIQKSLLNFPSMKNVIKILKRCLQEKKINYSYKGGLSSYVLFLLVYSFTKYNFVNNNKKLTSGELLIDFLFYYVMIIDFNHTLINANLKNPFLICYNLETIPTILDPITLNNAAKSVFKIFDVVNFFNEIYKDIYIINQKIIEKKKYENIIKILFDNCKDNKRNK